MKVDKADMDYYIYITKEDGRKISTPEKTLGGFGYSWLEAEVKSNPPIDETLGITCSNYYRVASAPGQITFDRGEDDDYPQDVNVRVFTPRILDLIGGRLKYIMTRYDRENKVWAFLEES